MSHSQPRVSVLLADIRDAPALRTTVRSVLAQTERDLELLLLDDQRSDLAEALEPIDDRRVIVVPAPGVGCAARLNLGIALAVGRFVLVLSPGTAELRAGCVERQADALDAEPGCDLAVIASAGRLPAASAGGPLCGSGAALLLGVIAGHVPPLASTLVRTTVLREIGGFDATLPRTHVADLWLRLLLGREILFLRDPLLHAEEGSRATAIDGDEDAGTRAERARTIVLGCHDHGGVDGLWHALSATRGAGDLRDRWVELSLLLIGTRLPEVAPLLRAARRRAARDGVVLPPDAVLEQLACEPASPLPMWPAEARPAATPTRLARSEDDQRAILGGAAAVHHLAALATRMQRTLRDLRRRAAPLAADVATLEHELAAARRAAGEAVELGNRALDKVRLTKRLRAAPSQLATRVRSALARSGRPSRSDGGDR